MSALLARLGLTRSGVDAHKTVTFGDASAVTGSRFWSVAALALLWLISSANEWVNPLF